MMTLVNFYVVPVIVLGCIYALGAIGVSLIYGVLRFGHFAHGDVLTFGAYISLTTVGLLGLPPLPTLPVVILVTAAGTIPIHPLFFRPLPHRPTTVVVI